MDQRQPDGKRVIGWISLQIASAEGDSFAAQLLEAANDSRTWSLASFGATVLRRRMEERDQFLFSPHAIPLFRDLIDAHDGASCHPPRARELVPSKTSRMLVGFKTRWESFEPPRLPARGVPRVPANDPATNDSR